MAHQCNIGKHTWDVPSLWEEVRKQDLKPFEVNPKVIDRSWWPWSDIQTMDQLIEVIKDIEKVDLKYPIILSRTGAVMDGFHRINKALWKNKPLLAVQFEKDPEPSHTKE